MATDNANNNETSSSKPFMSGLSEQTIPISKARNQLSYDEIKTIKGRASVANWQSAGDDGVYLNTHFPSWKPTDAAEPTLSDRPLERNIQPQLERLTFKMGDGSTSKGLKDYIEDDYYRVQAVVMAHKGKIVFESYNGMLPSQKHVWFSTSKTTVGTIVLLLERDGVLDLERTVSSYATVLQGSAWDNVKVKDVLNMCTALDLEETTAAFLDPNSWIEQFFSSLFEDDAPKDFVEVLRDVKPISGLNPGERFQYSTANTQALMLVCEYASNTSWIDLFNNYVWSKLHVRGSYQVGLATNGEAVPGGTNFTSAEDGLKYAMMYLPESWQYVCDEQVISDSLLRKIQSFGDPKAYNGTTEQGYSKQWFGEEAERNSCQWDAVFADGAMFKHGNMHQGIYVDPGRDFCAMYFCTCPNDRPDYTPGYLREAAKVLCSQK